MQSYLPLVMINAGFEYQGFVISASAFCRGKKKPQSYFLNTLGLNDSGCIHFDSKLFLTQQDVKK